MRITILPLVLIFSALIFLGSYSSAFAYENDIGQSQIHPAHPFYFLKTVREIFEMHFAQTPKVKFLRQLEFATRRLREARSLTQTPRQDLIEPTLERYWHHVSSLPAKAAKDLKTESLAKQISDSLVIHIKTLLKLYAETSNQRAKMAIRFALNRLMGRMDIPNYAKVPVCQFFAQEATQSADLAETEKVVLLERAEKCRKNYILEVVPSNK